jgi:beta-phosphoglucomutase family hydrolase
LFDLDGVLTRTARVHAAAWKDVFDEFLRQWSRRTGATFRPFDLPSDYVTFVDGRLREDGVRAFLGSRGIALPDGAASDDSGAESVHGLGRRKNDRFIERVRRSPVDTYEGSVRFVEVARESGLRCAVVSASRNCREVLASAGIEGLFELRVDGVTAANRGLRGKPAPDMFLAAAAALEVAPASAAVFEDAVAGVEAGRAGSFGWVVGVDHAGDSEVLQARGADVVVRDLAELLVE